MNLNKISLVAASAAVVLWAAKAVAIGSAGGLGRSPLENPFFLLGLLCNLTAVVTLTVAALVRRHALVRVGAAVGSVVAVFVLTALLGAAIDGVATNNSWVWEELNLWVLGLVVLAVAARRSARTATRTAARPVGVS
jgi:hypothetical protein